MRHAIAAAAVWLLAGAAESATVGVDCDAGASIGAVLPTLKTGDVLAVSGTCRESVLVPRHLVGVTLDGMGRATIVGGPPDVVPTRPSDFAIFVLGQEITVRGFTVVGGSHGIHLSGPASAVIHGNTLRGSGGAIHLDKSSTGQIYDNVIEDNPGFGIQLIENSYARIGFRIPTVPQPLPNTIRRNAGHGIIVSRWSSAWVVGNVIQHNGGHGVLVDRQSQADVTANDISANAGDGVRAIHGAGLNFSSEGSERNDGPNRSSLGPNSGAAVRCTIGGYVAGPLGTLAGRSGMRRVDNGCVERIHQR